MKNFIGYQFQGKADSNIDNVCHYRFHFYSVTYNKWNGKTFQSTDDLFSIEVQANIKPDEYQPKSGLKSGYSYRVEGLSLTNFSTNTAIRWLKKINSGENKLKTILKHSKRISWNKEADMLAPHRIDGKLFKLALEKNYSLKKVS